MRRVVAAFALLMLPAQNVAAALAHELTLTLPHPIRAGETAWVEVRVGPLRRGEEIDVTTPSGRLLGVISPFAVRSGHEAGTYTLPVPRNAIRNGRIAIRLAITQPNRPPRAATAQEVRSVKLLVAATRR
jgi:hypothetical protein